MALVSELSALVGRRFQKMSKLERGYKIKLRGRDLLFLGDRIYPTSYSIPATSPDNLSLAARSLLEGSKLVEVRQINMDRVIELRFDKGSIIFEMFRGGNIIVLNEENTIVSVLVAGKWSHRELRVGVMYKSPPPPLIATSFPSGDLRNLVRAGIPKIYANELLFRVGKNNLTAEELKEYLSMMFDELSSPAGYLCNNEPFPIQMEHIGCVKKYNTFSEVLDTFTTSIFEKKETIDAKENKKLIYMERGLQEIDAKITMLESMINEIYAHWGELEEMLASRSFRNVGKLKYKGKKGPYHVFTL